MATESGHWIWKIEDGKINQNAEQFPMMTFAYRSSFYLFYGQGVERRVVKEKCTLTEG
jgi:hypothetical protein